MSGFIGRAPGSWSVIHDALSLVSFARKTALRRPLSMTGLFVKALIVAALRANPNLPKGTRLRSQCQASLWVGLRA